MTEKNIGRGESRGPGIAVSWRVRERTGSRERERAPPSGCRASRDWRCVCLIVVSRGEYSSGAQCISIRMMRMCALVCVCARALTSERL